MADHRADPLPVAAPARLPGDALLRPIALVSLGLLLLNDHVLKAAYPGLLTGKLSDAAGMVLMPIVLWSAAELLLAALGRWRGPSPGGIAVATLVTGLAFASIKLVPGAALGAGWVLGAAQWSLGLFVRLAAGDAIGSIAPTAIVVDPTDLLALPCLLIAVWIGRQRLAAR
ncbi:MAG TPA: hypothetical protein VJ850_08130 [Candidatus Limnocylindrales bacterium]|nr:hypothetical protein [Candidatus Limnocylindrales bacterium]